MNNRYFKIDTGRYGGEVVIGTVTPEFVEYWKDRDESDLIEHVYGCEWEDERIDSDSPDMTADGNTYWHDVDDLEHLNGPYSDNMYWVTEIELVDGVELVNGELAWKEGVDHDYSTPMYNEISEPEQHNYGQYVYGREAYTHDYDPESGVEHTPVMCMHSAEKGGFGELVVQTEGTDFDPEKFAIGVCETDLCEIIEAYWYDGIDLPINFDYADTNGKGTYASVGYMNPAWHDDLSQYTHDSEIVRESLDDLFAEPA